MPVCMFLTFQYCAVTVTVLVEPRKRVMVSLTIPAANATNMNGMILRFIMFLPLRPRGRGMGLFSMACRLWQGWRRPMILDLSSFLRLLR